MFLACLCAGLAFGNVCVPCHKFYVLRVKEQIEEECVFPCDGISEKLLSYKNRKCTLFVRSLRSRSKFRQIFRLERKISAVQLLCDFSPLHFLF